MKYRYNTVIGIHEIEVDEQFYSVLQAMDREEYNANRKYSRHNPISLGNADYDGIWMEDGMNVLDGLIHAESHERLYATLAQLTHEQQVLIERIYLNHEKIVDIARKAGVSEAAVRDRLKKIYTKLKKMIE